MHTSRILLLLSIPLLNPAAIRTRRHRAGGGRGPDAAETRKKACAGLQPRTRVGKTLQCREFASIGSRITTEHCYPGQALERMLRQVDGAQAVLRKPGGGSCSEATCAN